MFIIFCAVKALFFRANTAQNRKNQHNTINHNPAHRAKPAPPIHAHTPAELYYAYST